MKRIIGLVVVIIIFIVINIIASSYKEDLIFFAKSVGSFGIIFYVTTTALAIIVPAWGNLFLIPVASSMWGPFYTAVLSIMGWVIGSQVSFLFGRLFEKRLIKKFPSLIRSNYVEKLVSENHPYMSLIFLRMTIPVDILSYGLGIFVARVTAYQNFITTLIGVIPFAFFFSYFNEIPKSFSVGIIILSFFLFAVYFLVVVKNK